jgi:hypothetical protein
MTYSGPFNRPPPEANASPLHQASFASRQGRGAEPDTRFKRATQTGQPAVTTWPGKQKLRGKREPAQEREKHFPTTT